MTGAHMSTKEITLRDPQKALREIKDTSLLLSIAGEYLCEEAFLKKMGFVLNHNIEVLEKHVKDLRAQFVGKPVREIELGPRLENINRIADLFQEVDDGIKQRCVEGELGRELSEKYASLTAGIHQLREMSEGTAVTYTKADSMKGFFGRLRFLLVSLMVTYKIASWVVGILVLVGLSTFSYLYLTMEKEEDVIQDIKRNDRVIEEKISRTAQIQEHLKTMQKKMSRLEKKKALSRQEEVALMELNLKTYKLADEQNQAEILIDLAKEEKEKHVERLMEMREKSFLERLIKR